MSMIKKSERVEIDDSNISELQRRTIAQEKLINSHPGLRKLASQIGAAIEDDAVAHGQRSSVQGEIRDAEGAIESLRRRKETTLVPEILDSCDRHIAQLERQIERLRKVDEEYKEAREATEVWIPPSGEPGDEGHFESILVESPTAESSVAEIRKSGLKKLTEEEKEALGLEDCEDEGQA
jgi:hypothetical protein